MTEQQEILRILTESWIKIRAKSPNYSLRAYARKLGLPPSTLSEILNGRHRVTRRVAERVLAKLFVDPDRAQAILAGLKNRTLDQTKAETGAEPQGKYILLDMQQFHIISQWQHFAILSLAETQGFKDDAGWIAGRLGISVTEAARAIERLLDFGLLARDRKGKLEPTGKQFQTSFGVEDLALRKSHFEDLELAQAAMEEEPFETCDFSSTTMAIDPDRIPEARRRIQKFRRSLCAYLESGRKKEVYRMSVQLFPLSNERK